MKRSISLARLCLAAILMGDLSLAMGQEESPNSTATAEHKVQSANVGTWDATITSYMGGPNAEPAVSNGTEVNEVLPGSLWMVSRFQGEIGGMKFEQRGQFGYDATKKKDFGTSIVSMNPKLAAFEGTYDARTKTMTYVGEVVEPGTKAGFTQKMVTTSEDDGTRVFKLYLKPDGAGDVEIKAMEIRFTKRN